MYIFLVYDNNIPFTEMFAKLLKDYTDMYDVEVIEYHSAEDLARYCLNNKFDIVYMDIGKENEMSLSKIPEKINPQALLKFISAYGISFKEMLNVESFQLASKELYRDERLEYRIRNSLNVAMRKSDFWDAWVYKFGKKKYSISLGKVKYFYSQARTVHIEGDTKGAPHYFYGKIDDIEKEIIKINDDFVRISKSYLVNMRYAGVYGKDQIMLGEGGKIIPVTRKYREEYRRRMKKSHWTMYFE